MNQIGRSMIEMMGVLAIIGVLSVGGINGYTKAMTKFKTNSTLEALMTISANVRTVTMRTKKLDGMNLKKVAIKMKAVPSEYVKDAENLNPNAFGGSIDIGVYNSRAFYVAMNGLPKDVCLDMATKDYGSAMIYAGTGDFSTTGNGYAHEMVSKELKWEKAGCEPSNLNVSNPPGAYCIKQIMSPTTAAVGCNCTMAGGCNVTLVMF